MNSLFSNEKLGMPVEKLRLEAIRQEIEARRLASEVQGQQSGVSTLISTLSTFIASCKNHLYTKLPKRTFIRRIIKMQMRYFERR